MGVIVIVLHQAENALVYSISFLGPGVLNVTSPEKERGPISGHQCALPEVTFYRAHGDRHLLEDRSVSGAL